MNKIQKADEYCCEKIANEVELDCIFEKWQKKSCICNKYLLFFVFFISIIVGSCLSLFILFIILIIPFSSIFVKTKLEIEEIFLNNSTYYDVFTKLNNGMDYQSEVDKLRYLHISNSFGLTIIFIILLFPYFFNKLKSIYFLLICLPFHTCIFILNIFISIIYTRVENAFKKYPNELDNMFASNGTHIIPLDKKDKLGITGASSIILCLIYYFLIIYLFAGKRAYEKEVKYSEEKNNNEYNDNLNSTN